MLVGVQACVYMYVCRYSSNRKRKNGNKMKEKSKLKLPSCGVLIVLCKVDAKNRYSMYERGAGCNYFFFPPPLLLVFWCMFLQISEYFVVLVTSSNTQ